MLMERKLKHNHVTGIKRQFKRSEKLAVQRREVKKETLTEDQVDIQKYLGLQLNEAEEHKQRGQ